MIAGNISFCRIRLAVCTVAGTALVERESVCHRAADLAGLLQSAHQFQIPSLAFLQISTKFSNIFAPYSESFTSG